MFHKLSLSNLVNQDYILNHPMFIDEEMDNEKEQRHVILNHLKK